MPKELSIIIINYNTFALTCSCIESVIRFTQGIDYELILVDNASVECSPDLFLAKFPAIRLIKSPSNVGFAKGNNLGIAQAQGEYILLLNSDTELLDNAIFSSLQKIKNNPKIGVLSTKLIFSDGRVQTCANRFPTLRLELIELFRLHKLLTAKAKANLMLGFYFDQQTEKVVDWVWGTFFLTRRKIIQLFPQQKLPDDFFMYFEDVEWCYSIQKMGYQILYFPEVAVVHHLSASVASENKSWAKLTKIAQNEWVFWQKKRGKLYANCLYFLRGLKYFSLRTSHFRALGRFYWQFIWKNKGGGNPV
jgi:GT2 family glycosyltransferase